MASLNILCSDLHNFLKEVAQKKKKKNRKEARKKTFCGPSKIFKNISWPINISLKYFMAAAKTLRPLPPSFHPSYIFNVRSLIKHT